MEIRVRKSTPLEGRVLIPGSKNSSLALIIASCLAKEACTLKHIPSISDVKVVCQLLHTIGVETEKSNDSLSINAKGINKEVEISEELSKNIRVSYYLVGALLNQYKSIKLGFPGGDNIGKRPIDQHIKGFEMLGATVIKKENHYLFQADQLVGNKIYLDVISCGATINLMMAAVTAKGQTVLYNTAIDPEVVDVAIYLNKMGGKIKGAGTSRITIEGVQELHGADYTVIPDRLVAGTMLIAAGVTGGDIMVENVIPSHLQAVLHKLREIGLSLKVYENSIIASGKQPLKACKTYCGMYPSFPTDLQQPLTVLCLKATGKSSIIDRVFPQRFNHCFELNKMGAHIIQGDGYVYMEGNQQLRGSRVMAKDIRGGIALLLAGLIAEGTTYVNDVHHIYRGYEEIDKTLQALGADIKIL